MSIHTQPSYAGLTRVSILFAKSLSKMMDCRVKPGNDDRERVKPGNDGGAIRTGLQLAQAKATLSSDFGPNFSEERATIRPPRAR
jgi:hypothetical protein